MKQIATCDGVRIERGAENGEPFVRVTFGHWSAACIFLMLWLAFWSFGCYMIVIDIFTKPFSFKLVLAALPFLAAAAVVFWQKGKESAKK